MSPKQLLAYFDRIAEAPGAMPRLRRFVRELAVRGKLVPQDERQRTTNRVAVRSKDGLSETPFPVPQSWSWVAVNSVSDARLGKMLDKAKNKGWPKRYLRNVNVRWFDFDLSDVFEMPFEDDELEEFSLRTGDVLVCEGGEPGRAAVWDEREQEIYFQKAIHRVRFVTNVVPQFFVIALRESFDSGRLAKYYTGVGIKHLTGRGLASFSFPLPPLAEQHRIVAKVDELMTLCDRLEAAQAERERRRSLFARTAHGHTRDRVRVAQPLWSSVTTQTTSIDHVALLRQTILRLAIQGRLNTAEASDPPAADYLGARLLVLESGVEPWLVPTGWAWSTLGIIGTSFGGGTPSKSNQEFWLGEIPWVSPKDMKVDRVLDAEDHITEEAIVNSAAKLIPVGALLMVVRGMILSHSFPTAISGVPVAINQDMKAVRPFRDDLTEFLLLATKAMKPEVLQLVKRSTHGTCKLLTAELFGLPLPMPPLAEQRRILDTVAELMSLCDRLEAQLATAQTESSHLLEAVLHQALEQASHRTARDRTAAPASAS